MNSSSRGFTLIELLVVVAIIGILASVVLISVSGSRAKARDSERISDLRNIRTALESFNTQYAHYPVSDPTNIGATLSYCWISGPSWITDNGSQTFAAYMPVTPHDPLGDAACSNYTWPGDANPGSLNPYSYLYWSNGRQFWLIGRLEDTTNPNVKNFVWIDGSVYTPASLGWSQATYVLSSGL